MSLKERTLFIIKKIIKNPLSYILIISLFIQKVVYSKFQPYSFSGDTLSYLSMYYKENIFLGEVNFSRTPVYPYLCKIVNLFSTESNFYNNIVFVQKILFFISIILFYLTVKKLFKSKMLNSILTLFYAINPFLFLWNTVLLTEALSIVEITTLLYLTISYIKSPRKSSAILIGVQLLILVMTRPANVYLLAGYLIFWILKFFIHRKDKLINIVKTGLITTCICIGIVLLYCNQFRIQHGQFGLTTVSKANTMITIIYSKLYKYGNNKSIIADIDKKYVSGDAYTTWDANSYVYQKYSNEQINSFVKSVKNNAKFNYIGTFLKKAFSCGPDSLGVIYSEPIVSTNLYVISLLSYNFLPISFSIVYFFLLGAFIFLIVNLIKRKEIEWVIAALFTIIAGNIFLSLFCAPFEWQRLSVISLPTIIILIPYLIREVFIISNKKVKKKKKTKKKKNMLNKNIEELFNYLIKFDIDKLFKKSTDNTLIQFFRYLFVGGIAALVNIGMLYVFTDFIRINYIVSNILSFTLGLFVNYILSKKFVFQGETTISKTKEFIIYAIIGILGLGIDTFLVWLFTDAFNFYYMISKLISTLLVFIWNFGARKVLYKVIK